MHAAIGCQNTAAHVQVITVPSCTYFFHMNSNSSPKHLPHLDHHCLLAEILTNANTEAHLPAPWSLHSQPSALYLLQRRSSTSFALKTFKNLTKCHLSTLLQTSPTLNEAEA